MIGVVSHLLKHETFITKNITIHLWFVCILFINVIKVSFLVFIVRPFSTALYLFLGYFSNMHSPDGHSWQKVPSPPPLILYFMKTSVFPTRGLGEGDPPPSPTIRKFAHSLPPGKIPPPADSPHQF